MLKKNNTYISEGGPIQTYRSIFMKNKSEKNSLGLTNSRYNELFSGSLQTVRYIEILLYLQIFLHETEHYIQLQFEGAN